MTISLRDGAKDQDYLFLSLTHTLFLSFCVHITHTHKHQHASNHLLLLFLSLSHTHTHTHKLPSSLCGLITRTHSLSLTLTVFHTHTHTHIRCCRQVVATKHVFVIAARQPVSNLSMTILHEAKMVSQSYIFGIH